MKSYVQICKSSFKKLCWQLNQLVYFHVLDLNQSKMLHNSFGECCQNIHESKTKSCPISWGQKVQDVKLVCVCVCVLLVVGVTQLRNQISTAPSLPHARARMHGHTHTHLEELSVFFRAGGTYQEENRVSESRVRYQVFFGPWFDWTCDWFRRSHGCGGCMIRFSSLKSGDR